MSIILKGIDLPKEGETMTVLAIDTDGSVMKMQYHEWHYTEGIEAIQIPKGHGRIGDLDELQTNVIKAMTYGDALHEIKKAPAMLESEVMPK